jgi:hypothetical protein
LICIGRRFPPPSFEKRAGGDNFTPKKIFISSRVMHSTAYLL